METPFMSKYQPLADHLAAYSGNVWPATFSEIEAVLGFPLPKAARGQSAWWSNESHASHTRAWTGPGWIVGDVDRQAETLIFKKPDAPVAVVEPPTKAPPEERFGEPAFSTKTAVVGGIVAAVFGVGALVVRTLLRRRK
jgi:hypothetical protein